MTLFLVLACGAGSVALGPEDGSTSDTGLTGDTGDTGEENNEPQAHAAEGDWSGDLFITVPEWDWELCEGRVELRVDEDGNVTGDGECTAESDWGDWEIPLDIEGAIDDDGELSGDVLLTFETRDGEEEIEARLSGDVDGDEMAFEFEGEMPWGGGGGGGGGAQDFVGEADLRR